MLTTSCFFNQYDHMHSSTTARICTSCSKLNYTVLKEFPVPLGSHPHDVAPTINDGTIWYTAQGSGKLGRLNRNTGSIQEITLGQG